MKDLLKALTISALLVFSPMSQAFAPVLALPAIWSWITTGTGALVAHSSGGVILTSSSGYVAGTFIPASVVSAAPAVTAGAAGVAATTAVTNEISK